MPREQEEKNAKCSAIKRIIAVLQLFPIHGTPNAIHCNGRSLASSRMAKKKSICLSLEYVDKLCHLPSSLFMLGHRTKFKTKIGGSHHNIKRPIVNVIKSPRQPIWYRPPSTKLYNLHCTGVVATATAAVATKNSHSTTDSVKTTAPKITKSITIMQNCY